MNMKVNYFLWISCFFLLTTGCRQINSQVYEEKTLPAKLDKTFYSSSDIIIPLSKKSTTEEYKPLIENLELLGILWGFIKYHHPEVGKGKYNLDYELFQMLPEYMKSNTSDRRDEILIQWIENFGEISECKTCRETSPDAVFKPDLSWVERFNMNAILKEKIKEIYQNRYQGNHYYGNYYAGFIPNGNFNFSRDSSYYSLSSFPDSGIRLLALYRYWNIIQYFFPYKHLTDKNWDAVFVEYIPKFVLAETELEYQLAVLLLTGEICDTHAVLLGANKIDSLRGNWQVPFRVRFVEDKLIVKEFFKPELKETDGLDVGDIITHVNGKSIESIVDSIKNYYPVSNETTRKLYMASDLLRSAENTMIIDYISFPDQVQHKRIQTLYDRYSLVANQNNNSSSIINLNNTSQSYKRLNLIPLKNDYIGYITLESIKNEDIDKIKKEFIDTKGIIIDIRNYPSAFVPFSLGSFFVSDNTPFAKILRGNVNNPGEFTFKPMIEITKSEETYQGKLVVIVNESTISSAEYHAMAFRAGANTTIIGSQTRGADGNVSQILLPGGLKTHFSGLGVYYPDGRETQRIGIVPDIEIKPTIRGIMEGRDQLLEKAIDIIRKE